MWGSKVKINNRVLIYYMKLKYDLTLPRPLVSLINIRCLEAKDRIHKHFIYGPSINNSEPSDHISTWKHLTRSQLTEFSQRSQLHLARSQLNDLCRRHHQHRHRFPHSPWSSSPLPIINSVTDSIAGAGIASSTNC
jgi:hypothetical protein